MSEQTARPSQVVDLNLLPSSMRPTEVSGRAAAVTLAFIVAIVGLLPVGWEVGTMRNEAAAMERRADDADARLETMQAELALSRALRLEIDDARSEIGRVEAERETLQQGARPLQDDLAMLFGWGFLPRGARVTKVSASDSGFRVDGTAAGPLDAIAYAENLVSDGGFPSARMSSFTPAGNGGTFAIDVARQEMP